MNSGGSEVGHAMRGVVHFRRVNFWQVLQIDLLMVGGARIFFVITCAFCWVRKGPEINSQYFEKGILDGFIDNFQLQICNIVFFAKLTFGSLLFLDAFFRWPDTLDNLTIYLKPGGENADSYGR